MILDGFLSFSQTTATPYADSPTAATVNVSTNVIDLHLTGIPSLASGVGARDWGIGDDPAIKVLVQVATAFTGTGGAPTLAVALQGAPDNGSGLPGSYTTFYSSAALAPASLGAGARLLDMDMPRPPPGVGIPRFLRLAYTIASTVMSAGAVSGFLVIDRHDQVYQGINNAVLGGYPAGITVAN